MHGIQQWCPLMAFIQAAFPSTRDAVTLSHDARGQRTSLLEENRVTTA